MDKGEIHLDDLDLSDLAMHERARKGALLACRQEASIFRKLTIAENIMAIPETRKDLNKQRRRAAWPNCLYLKDYPILKIRWA